MPIRMVPYQSEEAKQALGKSYRPGRPKPPSWSVLTGRLPVGLMPFWPSCLASRVGGSSQSSLSFPLVKPFGYLLYWFMARYGIPSSARFRLQGFPRISYAKSRNTHQ